MFEWIFRQPTESTKEAYVICTPSSLLYITLIILLNKMVVADQVSKTVVVLL